MRIARKQNRTGRRHAPRPIAAGFLIAAVLVAAPFAVAATGDVLRQGVKNGPISKETEIIGTFNYKPVKGGYVTRQSNTKTGTKAGGAAIYGCRTDAKPVGAVPCVRANNLETGHAFQFRTSGDVGGTIATDDATGKPFTTTATGVADGLNADRVDGYHASQLISESRADTMWAVLAANGTLLRGKGASSPFHTGTGDYRVNFARDLDGCSMQVSITRPGSSGTLPDPGTAFGTMLATNKKRAVVRTFDVTGAASDRPVAITVNC